MKLGDVLADMVLYGDIDAAPLDNTSSIGMECAGEEVLVRLAVAATLRKLTHDFPGGRCSEHDELVSEHLKREIK